MIRFDFSLLSFLPAFAASAFGMSMIVWHVQAGSVEVDRPLIAYVETFSSPLKDMLPTQVELPPGNGRGIHIF